MQGNLVVDMLESNRVDPARKLQLEVVLGKILGGSTKHGNIVPECLLSPGLIADLWNYENHNLGRDHQEPQ
jgi:hypothetical protein